MTVIAVLHQATNMQRSNPVLSLPLRLFGLVLAVVLGSSFVLFFFLPNPETPFNGKFLGAIYLASMGVGVMLLIVNRWAPARLVLPMVFIFSLIVLVISSLHISRFDFQGASGWSWFFLYSLQTVVSAYYLWYYRHLPPSDPRRLPTMWHRIILGQMVVLGAYGIGLLVAPTTFTSFWPWRIDDYHGQLYSAIFIAGALGCGLLARGAAPVELATLAVSQVLFSLFAIIGVVVVDSTVHTVNWFASGTWAWFGAFALLFVAGIGMLVQSRALARAAPSAVVGAR